MNRYFVISPLVADRELAEIWNRATNRQAIAKASDKADLLLASDPKSHARHLSEELWMLRSSPLRIYFSVSEVDRVVVITNVLLDAAD